MLQELAEIVFPQVLLDLAEGPQFAFSPQVVVVFQLEGAEEDQPVGCIILVEVFEVVVQVLQGSLRQQSVQDAAVRAGFSGQPG